MIERYTRPEMGRLFSEQSRLRGWLDVELAAVRARAQNGEVPTQDLAAIEAGARVDPQRVREIELKTRHDVAAFVDSIAEQVGPAARHIHHGMTSSDVVDTALALQLAEAADLLLEGLRLLFTSIQNRAIEHAQTPMVGRTHGMHAEPTTFGLKLASWAFEVLRAAERLRRAKVAIAVGKLSGTVGAYSQLSPDVEAAVMRSLGLSAEPAASQVVARDRHAEFLCALALAASAIERFATEIRHLQRAEVAEVQEPFAHGEQKGSSAMPHKRNPIVSERMCGLARLIRAYVAPMLEDIALWHERDISHSSVERVVLADACILLDYMTATFTEVIDGLNVYPEAMRRNLHAGGGVVFSQTVLLALVNAGVARDDAYRWVQNHAAAASAQGVQMKDLMLADSNITQRLSAGELEECFDEEPFLERAGVVIERLKAASFNVSNGGN